MYEHDGGPAFPAGGQQTGMSLRDYFAGQALAGEFAAQNEHCGAFHPDTSEEVLFQRARFLYRMADSMLKAREASNA